MATPNDAEYNQVIRVTKDTHLAPSHVLVLATDPVHITTFCRTMTLAQGRILYEVWDYDNLYHHRCLGYILPAEVYASGPGPQSDRREDWRVYDPVTIRRREGAWAAIFRLFPRIPTFGARRLVETLMRARIFGSNGFAIEKAVVEYALEHWTSYKLRLESLGGEWYERKRAEEKARSVVAQRTKEVLESWMAPDVGWERVDEFFARHELLEAAPLVFKTYGYGRQFT